jgi:hypothetical protein
LTALALDHWVRSSSRSAVRCWRSYLASWERHRCRTSAARRYASASCARRVLTAWHHTTDELLIRRRRLHACSAAVHQASLRRKLRQWNCAVEALRADAEELAMCRALALCRHQLLRGGWFRWSAWIDQWRLRRERFDTRCRLRSLEYTERLLLAWRSYARRRVRCAELLLIGKQHRRRTLVSRTWSLWVYRQQCEEEDRLHTHRAMEHHELQLLCACFTQWQNRASALASKHCKYELADQHCRYALALHCLMRLWTAALQARQVLLNKRRAVRHNYFRLLQHGQRGWRRYIRHRRAYHVKLGAADDMCNRLTCCWVFRHLGTYVTYTHHRRRLRAKASLHWGISLKRATLFEMRAHTALKQMCRQRSGRAILHWRITEERKVLDHWHKFMYIQQQQDRLLAMRVHEATGHINIGRLARAMSAWFDIHSAAVLRRLAAARSMGHWCQKLSTAVLKAWHQALRRACLKRAVSALALRHRCDKLCSTCMWGLRLLVASRRLKRSKVRMSQQSNGARLCRGCLRAWVCAHADRMNKKDQMREAIRIRRTMLLKRGCEQWLDSAFQMRTWRSEVALRRQAEQHARLCARVARYARHWRCKTLARRAERQQRLETSGYSGYSAAHRASGPRLLPSRYEREFEQTFAVPLPTLHRASPAPLALAVHKAASVDKPSEPTFDPAFSGSRCRRPPRRPSYLYDDEITSSVQASLVKHGDSSAAARTAPQSDVQASLAITDQSPAKAIHAPHEAHNLEGWPGNTAFEQPAMFVTATCIPQEPTARLNDTCCVPDSESTIHSAHSTLPSSPAPGITEPTLRPSAWSMAAAEHDFLVAMQTRASCIPPSTQTELQTGRKASGQRCFQPIPPQRSEVCQEPVQEMRSACAMWTSFEHVAATNADKENSPRVDGLMTAGLTESPLKRRREHALPNSVPGACSVSVPIDQHSVQPSAGSGIDAVQSQAVQLSSVKEQIAQLQREVASTKKTMSKLHSDKDQPIRSSQPNMNAPAQNVCSTTQSQLSDREQSKVETYSPSQHEGSGQAMQSSEAEMAKIEGVLLEFRGLQERCERLRSLRFMAIPLFSLGTKYMPQRGRSWMQSSCAPPARLCQFTW